MNDYYQTAEGALVWTNRPPPGAGVLTADEAADVAADIAADPDPEFMTEAKESAREKDRERLTAALEDDPGKVVDLLLGDL